MAKGKARTPVDEIFWQDLVLQNGPWLLACIDKQGLIREINGQELTKLSWTRQELLKKPLKDILDPGSPLLEAISDVLETESPKSMELEWAGFVYQVKLSPIQFEGKANVAALFLDNSEQFRLHRQLVENEERFRRLTEVALEGIAILENGIIQDANPRLSMCFGYSVYEILGMNFLDLVHKEDVPKISQALYSDREHFLEARFYHVEDHVFPGEINIKKLDSSMPGSAVVALRDITYREEAREEIRRKNQALQDKNTELEKANLDLQKAYQELQEAHETGKVLEKKLSEAERKASLGSMAAGVAHEISQPLNGLKITVDGIEYWFSQGKDIKVSTIREKLKKVGSYANKISEIVNQMRAFYQNQTDQALVPTDLNVCIREAMELVQSQLKKKGIQLEIMLQEPLPQVLAHPIQVEQTIINLVQNSSHALDKNPLPEPCWIRVKTYCDQEMVHLEIEDNGVGLGKNENKIFDPFFSETPSGMGLGLSVVQNFVHHWDAKIQARNRQGGGACFQIEFPVFQEDHRSS